jgi:hypothetical protein
VILNGDYYQMLRLLCRPTGINEVSSIICTLPRTDKTDLRHSAVSRELRAKPVLIGLTLRPLNSTVRQGRRDGNPALTMGEKVPIKRNSRQNRHSHDCHRASSAGNYVRRPRREACLRGGTLGR